MEGESQQITWLAALVKLVDSALHCHSVHPDDPCLLSTRVLSVLHAAAALLPLLLSLSFPFPLPMHLLLPLPLPLLLHLRLHLLLFCLSLHSYKPR